MSANAKRRREAMIVTTADPPLPDEPARALHDAMWAGDIDALQRLAHCVCCCHEHTHGSGCPAYAWGGCRGQDSLSRQDIRGWAEHYGMTVEQFYGYGA